MTFKKGTMTGENNHAYSHGYATRGNVHPIYRAYCEIRTRTGNPKYKQWNDYGGRGIKNLFGSFQEFLAVMKDTWFPGATVDRINSDDHYRPGNVRWATRKQQNQNKKSNRVIEFQGQRLLLQQWADRLELSASSLYERLQKWPIEKALTLPSKRIRCRI